MSQSATWESQPAFSFRCFCGEDLFSGECSNPNSSGDASFLTQISKDTLDRVIWDLVLLAGFVFPFYLFNFCLFFFLFETRSLVA